VLAAWVLHGDCDGAHCEGLCSPVSGDVCVWLRIRAAGELCWVPFKPCEEQKQEKKKPKTQVPFGLQTFRLFPVAG